MSEHPGETYTHLSLPLFLVPGVIKGTDYFPTKALQNTGRSKWGVGGNSRINLHPHLSPAPPGKGGGWRRREREGGRKDRKGRDHQQVLHYHWLHHVPPRPETLASQSFNAPSQTLDRPSPRWGAQRGPSGQRDQGLAAGVSPTDGRIRRAPRGPLK